LFDEDRLVLEFTGLKANTNTVIRIDLTIECNINCGCGCPIGDDKCTCGSTGYVRIDRVNTAHKRFIHEYQQFIGDESYSLAMVLNDYVVDGEENQIPSVFVNFTDICNVMSCIDYTGCYTGVVSDKAEGSYKDRYCIWEPVSCDDGDPCTIDQCLPPSEYEPVRNFPPNCIHIDSCESEQLSGYCYDYASRVPWNCNKNCFNDDSCDGGLCFYIDQEYCMIGEGEAKYCYFAEDNFGFDCTLSCDLDSDCGDGGKCYNTIQCSSKFMPLLLQQEDSEFGDNSKQRTTLSGLSSIQLGAIIGGCVGFVGILMIVIVIIKRSHQNKINTETFDTLQTLQVPLNQ